ncbi:MAG: hypothetical protein J6B56_00845 [Clostridia bacterium]|nr:hypothetical protein [Clostridia bacterium]
MNKNWKKTFSLVMATVCLGSAVALASCNGAYAGNKLEDYVSEAAVASNGGFAVEKGDFVYFINGLEDYSEPNVYGDVVKGSLMRIKKADLNAGNYENVKTVVPMLFVAQNFDAGIYIYGDYVYYATPTTDKNMDGEVEYSWIDFKRAKLDGTEAMKDYYFRLSSNSSNYRFVEEDGVVYCLYEEGGYLKSYDTKDKVSRVLAKADSYYYDTSDPTNPNVYYTMSVVVDGDTDNSTTAAYNQLYSVNAAARVESVGEKNGVASYKVKGGKEYKFDAKYLKEQSDEAENSGGEASFDAKDYTTYPYVNLGKAVLDGIGSNALKETQFNGKKADALTPDGYNYTVTGYANGGVYFTRTEVAKTSSDGENTKLYYLADAASAAEGWNVVSGNGSEEIDVVALDSTLVSSAIFKTTASGAHEYYYLSESTLYKATASENGEATQIRIANNLSEATLWKMEGDFLYYYQAASEGNGNSLSRVNVTGEQKDYNTLLEKVEYQPITLAGVQFNSSWYKPEIFGDTLLYANEQSFGSETYNYIYAAKLPATQAEIKAKNEKYEAVQDAIDEYSDNADLQDVMTYYFRTGKTTAYDAVKDLYDVNTEQKYFDEFKAKFSAETDKLEKENYFFALVGEMKEADEKEIDEAWVESLRSEKEEDETKGLPGWAIALIVAGSVLVVAAAVLIPTLLALSKKKAKAKAAEETVNAYKRKKIDTTDDKSIDVYADEEETEAEETPVETEESAEEAEEASEAEKDE